MYSETISIRYEISTKKIHSMDNNSARGGYCWWHIQLQLATPRYLRQDIRAAYIFGAVLKL